MFLRQAPRDYAPRDKLGTGGTGPARGASACAARGTPIFVLSRRQFMKYAGWNAAIRTCIQYM
ncbi:MAG: hypothetical protein OES18_24530 [Deltaproteobacteria bacterium]|nr:hypothetical protein [Deltaproteobacteria bacterium]